MKKVMIRCDMEGSSGIISKAQADPQGSEYIIGQQYFMSDLIALTEGLIMGGVEEIIIYDEHYFGRNVLLEKLDKRVQVISGKPPYTSLWAGGLDEIFDGLILCGFHSMQGSGKLLHHTYEYDIRAMFLNKKMIGEIGLETAIAADYGVPLVMIVADSGGVAEAKELSPEVASVITKESLDEDAALCYSIPKTYNDIFEVAKIVGAKSFKRVSPQRYNELSVVLFENEFSMVYKKEFGEPRFIGTTVTECFAKYWSNKLKVKEIRSSKPTK